MTNEAKAEVSVAKDNKLFGQISKFAVVGVLNTILDITILNVLILVFGVNPVISNIISVSVAIINSYVLNKYWTFNDKENNNLIGQFGIFLALSLVGLAINTAVLNLLYVVWTSPGHLVFSIVEFVKFDSVFKESFVLLNFAKAWAIGSAMIWNFIAYKKWAFKK